MRSLSVTNWYFSTLQKVHKTPFRLWHLWTPYSVFLNSCLSSSPHTGEHQWPALLCHAPAPLPPYTLLPNQPATGGPILGRCRHKELRRSLLPTNYKRDSPRWSRNGDPKIFCELSWVLSHLPLHCYLERCGILWKPYKSSKCITGTLRLVWGRNIRLLWTHLHGLDEFKTSKVRP